MNNKRVPPKKSDARAMPLEGEEAIQLYTAEIADSKQLLDEID